MLDVCFAELAAQLRPKLTSVKAFVVLTDRGSMHRAVCCHPQFPHHAPCNTTLVWRGGERSSACNSDVCVGPARVLIH